MFRRNALYGAIIAATSISQAQAQLEEVIVTATKTESSAQDVPIAITALGEESLSQLGVTNFSDYLVQLPGVTAGGGGPGTSTIYIRGVASTTPNLTTSGVAGLAPNVAFYLDEQPLTQPGRNLDVYAADLNRIEVLKGPQGTLFGASSQAGTVRLITNKPDPTGGVYGTLKIGTAYTEKGEPSYNAEGAINLPVTDNFALRGVVYVDHQGGYIDNVAGTLTARDSARFQPGGFQGNSDLSGVNFLETSNATRTEEDFNEATYAGGRLAGKWDINDDWSLLVGVAQQSIDSEGVFFVDPELDELEISRYEQDTLEDDFVNANWTINGRLGSLDLLYTGAYTEREANSRIDYTDYLFVGQYIPYYICDYSVSYPSGAPSGTCQPPNLFVKSYVKTEVQSHEFRISTDQSRSIRGIGGFFYSNMEVREDNQFTYPGSTQVVAADGESIGFGPNFSAEGASVRDPSQWAPGVVFRNDVLRTDEQLGLFGEVYFDLGEQFTVTVGARWYDVEVDLKGSAAGSFGNLGATEDNNAGNNLDEIFADQSAQSDGVIGKISLQWMPTSDQLYYVTWSEGYRPGFLNRPGGAVSQDGTYTVPFTFETDEVTNYEFGWKLDMLDQTLRFNGDIFFVDIADMQVGIFDPSITNLFFADNAADAEVLGLEGDLIWAPASVTGLTLSGGFSFLDTEITDSFVTNFVQEGDELAFAPKFQATINARYEWDLSSGKMAHVMLNGSYSEKANTDIVAQNSITLDTWSLWNFTTGISDELWVAELYVDNLADERAPISGNAIFNRSRVTMARPRTLGIRFSYNF